MSTSAVSVFLQEVPSNMITDNTFAFRKHALPSKLDAGAIRVRLLQVSIDPSKRISLAGMSVNDVLSSSSTAQVLESNAPAFVRGDIVSGVFEWSTISIVPAEAMVVVSKVSIPNPTLYPRRQLSQCLSVFGHIGITAYMGLIDVGRIQKRSTVFITAAAGSTGSIAGQIAKHVFGCYVVGSAGSKAKCDFLVNELGFDDALNYKLYNNDSALFQKDLKKCFAKANAALNRTVDGNGSGSGIDLYFDNTGGFQTEAVWELMNRHSRVVICGQIANYNKAKVAYIRDFLFFTIMKSIHIEGFLITDFRRYDDFFRDMGQWVDDGKVISKETVVQGFDNLPSAMRGIFTGINTGKMVCEVARPDLSLIPNKNGNDDDSVVQYPDFARLYATAFTPEVMDAYFYGEVKKSKL